MIDAPSSLTLELPLPAGFLLHEKYQPLLSSVCIICGQNHPKLIQAQTWHLLPCLDSSSSPSIDGMSLICCGPAALTSLREGGNNLNMKLTEQEALPGDGETKFPRSLFEHLHPVFHEVTPKSFSFVKQNLSVPRFAL